MYVQKQRIFYFCFALKSDRMNMSHFLYMGHLLVSQKTSKFMLVYGTLWDILTDFCSSDFWDKKMSHPVYYDPYFLFLFWSQKLFARFEILANNRPSICVFSKKKQISNIFFYLFVFWDPYWCENQKKRKNNQYWLFVFALIACF